MFFTFLNLPFRRMQEDVCRNCEIRNIPKS